MLFFARENRRKRKLANLNTLTGGTVFTDNELGDAVIRESEAIVLATGGAVAPAWFGPAINAAMKNSVNAVINTAIAPLLAAQANERVYRHNYICFRQQIFFSTRN